MIQEHKLTIEEIEGCLQLFRRWKMEERDQRRLIECLYRNDGSVTVREVQQWLLFVLSASVDVDRCRQGSEGEGNTVQLVDPAYCLNDFGLEN